MYNTRIRSLGYALSFLKCIAFSLVLVIIGSTGSAAIASRCEERCQERYDRCMNRVIQKSAEAIGNNLAVLANKGRGSVSTYNNQDDSRECEDKMDDCMDSCSGDSD